MEEKEVLIKFEERVQKIILKTKIRILDIEEKRLTSQKTSILDKIIGKEDLKKAKLNNIYARKQLAMLEHSDTNYEKSDVNDIISDLYVYSYINLNNQFTDEMNCVYDDICKDESLNSLINLNKINELVTRKVNHNVNINLVNEINIKGIGKVGKEISKLEMNTNRINKKTQSLEVKKDENIFKIYEI